MKLILLTLAFLLIGFIIYLGFNNFEITPNFLFDKTNQTTGTVVNTQLTYGVKGTYLQLVTYEYQVGDSLYSDRFKAGRRQGIQVIGNKLLIMYAVRKPQKNKIIGYYKHSRNSDTTTKKQKSEAYN